MLRQRAIGRAKSSVKQALLHSGLWDWAQANQSPPPVAAPSIDDPPTEVESDQDDWQAEFEQALLELEAEEVEETVEREATSEEVEPASERSSRSSDLTVENVQEVLDELVRPALQADGGDISLVRIENNNIYVELIGACASCPSSTMTMKMGIEQMLQDEFPELNELINVAGEPQPFF